MPVSNMRPIAAPEGKRHDTACIPTALFPPKIGLSCLYCLWRSRAHPAGSAARVKVKPARLQPAQGRCWHVAPQPWLSAVKEMCPPAPLDCLALGSSSSPWACLTHTELLAGPGCFHSCPDIPWLPFPDGAAGVAHVVKL